MKLNYHLNKFAAFLACLSTLTIASSAFAEDFYVAQSALGTGNGTSAANAYPVSFFNNSTNWASGAGKIGPGDTVHLVGTISTSLLVQTSGASGSPITIFFEAGAKLSTAYWGTTTAAALSSTGTNFIIVDGANKGIIECTGNGDGLANQQQSHGMYLYNCSNWEIKNLTIRNIYNHIYNTNNLVSPYTTVCIKAANCSNLAVHDCNLNNAYSALYYLTDRAVALSGLDVHNNVMAACSTDIIAALGASGSSMDSINIYNNDIAMGVNWFDTPDNNHVDGIHCWTTNLGDLTNLKIFGNYIHGDCGGHCTGYVFLENLMTSPQVYNNLLVATNSKPAEAFIDVSTHGGTRMVYNNTIVGLGTANTGGIGVVFYDGASSTASVKNNIFSNLYVAISTATSETMNCDYNNYFNCGNVGYTTAFKSTLANWQATKGGDAHSILSNPLFNADYTIPTSSPAAKAGINLYSTFSTDKSGNARQQSPSAWDTGAYLAGASSAGSAIVPPSNASVAITLQ